MPARAGYRCAGIIGTGLIGGSLGLALQRGGGVDKVLGYDSDAEMLERAIACKAIQQAAASLADLSKSCDLIFIAVPVRTIEKVMADVAPHLASGTTISDVGSVKERVVEAAAKILPKDTNFIGGHPLAGSEQRGVESADADLFREAYYVLTPGAGCSDDAYSRLHALLTSMGARVIAMEPRQHDRAVSVISHIPHIMAMSLMNLALERAEEYPLLRLTAGGFRDMTRIAASNPGIWLDILLENRDAIAESLDESMEMLRHMGKMLEGADENELEAWMEAASRGRQSLAPALRESLEELFNMTLAIENRPGVISDVTLAVGELGINIVDIELMHPLESAQALLRLSISGEEDANRAAEALRARGYRVALSRALGGQ